MDQTFENTRSCSYCESATHNIRGCDSPDINILCDAASTAFVTIRRTNTQEQTKDLYTTWLKNTYNLRQLKVIAVTRMNDMVSGRTKADYADKVWYVNNFVYEMALEEEVEEVEEVEVEEVSWYIDRNPNPSTELDGFQTPETMSPRGPPELVRQNNNIILNDDDDDDYDYDDDDDELLINSRFPPPHIGFGYIPSISRNDIRRSSVRLRVREIPTFDINVKIQEFIGLYELLEDNFECPICYETHDKSLKLVLGCNHEFCTGCVIETLKTNKSQCAFCRDEMKQFIVYNEKELDKFKNYCCVK